MRNPLLRVSSIAAPLTAAALTVATLAPAAAADLPMRYKAPPMIAPVFSWTGYYIGGQLAFTDGKDSLMEYFTASRAFTGFARKNDVSGLSGGAYTGVNYQTGFWVWGLEGDVDGGNLKGGWIDTPTGGQGASKVDIQGSLRGRIGIASDKVLFYATGGAAFGNVSHTYTNLLTGIVETTTSVRTGWTAGGGVEVAFTPNWLLRAEYRYTDYGLSSYSSVTSFPGLTGTQEVKLHSLRLGAAYKF